MAHGSFVGVVPVRVTLGFYLFDMLSLSDYVIEGWPENVDFWIYAFLCSPRWMTIFIRIVGTYDDSYGVIAVCFPIIMLQSM
jgi:hypothetical protein